MLVCGWPFTHWVKDNTQLFWDNREGHGDTASVALGTCSRECLELASNYFKRVGDLDPKFYFGP